MESAPFFPLSTLVLTSRENECSHIFHIPSIFLGIPNIDDIVLCLFVKYDKRVVQFNDSKIICCQYSIDDSRFRRLFLSTILRMLQLFDVLSFAVFISLYRFIVGELLPPFFWFLYYYVFYFCWMDRSLMCLSPVFVTVQ